MAEPVLTGRCNCGAVRFEIDAPLVGAAYCHCTRCQRRTGAAAGASGVCAPGSFRLVTGADHVRAWEPEGGSAKYFCPTCGSGLFVRDPADPDLVAVRLGVLDGDPGVRPALRQFVANAAVWEPMPDDGLPRYAGRRPT
jgi:hypothetical protein